MAEFNSYLLGKASKSVGNVTLFYVKKKNIARAIQAQGHGDAGDTHAARQAGHPLAGGQADAAGGPQGLRGRGERFAFQCLCAAEHGCRGGGRRLQCHHQLPAVARGFGHPDYAEGGSHLQRAGQPVFFHRRVAGGGGRLRADGRQGVCRALRVGAEAHALGGFGDTGRA